MTTPAPLSGNQKRKMRSASRLYAVQALYQMEITGVSFDRVKAEFLDIRFGAEIDGEELIDGDVTLFGDILEGAVKWQALIDQCTDRALVAKWPLGRIDTTLRALFRAAGSELQAKDTPPKVVITEYVDVARAFFPEGKEAGFVNGVLDHIARELCPEAF
ncbi:transcription antitermination factor NusB [Donghicola sp. C2-DW-16]|uniref:Transcription antitermination protein NusB n=1 Tax=Donghicola mangrovi TaxID=2729614 RepID=A0A850QD58_9RHOB|nr:transcription antitermination factor NusB [Donghicola mangrovi]NVO24830.1 transcription antitermination factor NusB [Donghicola mangrovi]NVO29061.1 transcription antitermination factor NusB [Donghicola mangrovi]